MLKTAGKVCALSVAAFILGMHGMIAAVSLVSLLLGTALACAAEHVPDYVEVLEGGGGALVLAGLALIGSALPFAA